MSKKKSFRDIPRIYELHVECTNDKKIVCEICQQKIKSISGFGSHLINKHGITLDRYVAQYFKCMSPNFKFEKCGFCDKQAMPEMNVDYKNQTYSLSYNHGYCCNTHDCKDNISLSILGMHYDEAFKQKKFEHIGANTKYLAKLYKKPEEYIANKIKHNENYILPEASKTNLTGYIARYGKDLGTQKYNERCSKIKRSMTVDWFIEKYGISEGVKKYQARFTSLIAATADITHSKNQYKIFDALRQQDNNWKDEEYVNGVARVDMVNYNCKVAIEYFGDYWHCNPAIYADDYYHKILKAYAIDKQNFDKARLAKILGYGDAVSLIIVVWEKTFADMKFEVSTLLKNIYNIIENHNTSKKEIVWI